MSSGSPWVSLGLGSPRPNGPDTPRQVWGSTLQVSASRVDALPYTLHPTHYPIQCHASEALTLLLDNCSLKGFSIGKNFLAYIAGGLWMVAIDSCSLNGPHGLKWWLVPHQLVATGAVMTVRRGVLFQPSAPGCMEPHVPSPQCDLHGETPAQPTQPALGSGQVWGMHRQWKKIYQESAASLENNGQHGTKHSTDPSDF